MFRYKPFTGQPLKQVNVRNVITLNKVCYVRHIIINIIIPNEVMNKKSFLIHNYKNEMFSFIIIVYLSIIRS